MGVRCSRSIAFPAVEICVDSSTIAGSAAVLADRRQPQLKRSDTTRFSYTRLFLIAQAHKISVRNNHLLARLRRLQEHLLACVSASSGSSCA